MVQVCVSVCVHIGGVWSHFQILVCWPVIVGTYVLRQVSLFMSTCSLCGIYMFLKCKEIFVKVKKKTFANLL